MKNTILKIVLWLITILTVGILPLFAQSEMSKEQVISFLNQKLSELKGFEDTNYSERFLNGSIRAEGSNVRLKIVSKETKGEFKFWNRIYVFNPVNIKDLLVSGSTVYVNFPKNSITTYTDIEDIEASLVDDEMRRTDDSLYFNYIKGDGTNGEKIEKAFLRLKELYSAEKDKMPQQEGPTLEETFEFLKGKINGNKVFQKGSYNENFFKTYQVTYAYTEMKVEGVKLTLQYDFSLQESWYLKSGTERATENCSSKITIFLDELIPSNIKVSENEGNYFVDMKASVNKKIEVDKTCTATGWYKNNSSYKKIDSFSIAFSDRETAEKVAKALTHAVKLSGGKNELF